jgi:proteasome lid subunit RPN8/RPN11
VKRLRLSSEAAAVIRKESAAAHPREACGLLVGTSKGETLDALEAAACRNIAEDPRRFELHPEDFLRTELKAASRNLRVLGAWHSHPDAPATPSDADKRGADPAWVHVIAGTRGPCVSSIRAWNFAAPSQIEVSLTVQAEDAADRPTR